MNVKRLRAEVRAVRRASMRLMHNSLSMVGLASVALIGIAVTHPEYAQSAGRWFMPAQEPRALPAQAVPVAATQPEALVSAITHPSGEAGRLLGLVVPDHGAAPVAPGLSLDKVSAAATRPTASREQRDATSYLSKKYRINSDAIAMLVDAAYVTGRDLNLDPLLLLSVMGVESGFNPFAESTAGASGLMQLMSKVHRDKLNDFGGRNIALNPVVNLRVGAVVLRDCIRRGGSIPDGLRLYVGAGMGDDNGYGARVLQEKDRLAQAVRSANRVAPTAVAKAPRPPRDDDKRDAKPDDRADARPADSDDPDHGRFARERVASL